LKKIFWALLISSLILPSLSFAQQTNSTDNDIGLDAPFALTAKQIDSLVEKRFMNYIELNDFNYDKYLRARHKHDGYLVMGLIAANTYIGLEQRDTKNSQKMHDALGYALGIKMIDNAASGLYAHRDDLFDFSDGITSKHIHALLGSLATYLIVSNVLDPSADDHKEHAIAGSVLSLVGYGFTLF